MSLLPFKRKQSDDSNLHSLLRLAQASDDAARNQLIEQFVPFVLKIASQASGRYVERGKDDEFSVGLMAFNEAINSYDGSRNASFLSFAEVVIRRRLVDHFRSLRTARNTVPWTDFDVTDDEDNVQNQIEISAAIEEHRRNEERSRRQTEIQEFTKRITEFGVTLPDLVEASPKHADARRAAIEVARIISRDEYLLAYVLERKLLPLRALEDRVAMSRKTLERQRKYILATVLLLSGDFEVLHEYVLS